MRIRTLALAALCAGAALLAPGRADAAPRYVRYGRHVVYREAFRAPRYYAASPYYYDPYFYDGFRTGFVYARPRVFVAGPRFYRPRVGFVVRW